MAVNSAEIARQLGITADQARALFNHLNAHMSGKSVEMSAKMADKIRAALRGKVSSETLEHAGQLAERAYASMSSQMSDSALNSIGSQIGEAIAEGRRPRDMGHKLDQITQLNNQQASSLEKKRRYWEAKGLSPEEVDRKVNREFDKQLRKRRRSIAHTEGRDITSSARDREGRLQGARWKVWRTVGDDRVGEDHEANEAAGPIPLDDTFPSGDLRPPGRPNCRCAITYIKSDKSKDIAARQSQRRVEQIQRRKADAAEEN